MDPSVTHMSANELLDSARNESIIVRASDGTPFVLSLADDFVTEGELLRQNHACLALLDTYKQEQKTLSLEEVEERLR